MSCMNTYTILFFVLVNYPSGVKAFSMLLCAPWYKTCMIQMCTRNTGHSVYSVSFSSILFSDLFKMKFAFQNEPCFIWQQSVNHDQKFGLHLGISIFVIQTATEILNRRLAMSQITFALQQDRMGWEIVIREKKEEQDKSLGFTPRISQKSQVSPSTCA